MVTIKDIAKATGVTFSTVSRALNNQPGVSEKMRKKIVAVAEQMNYRPNLAAKKLVLQKTNYIGLIWPKAEGLFFYNLSTHLHKEAEKRGFHVIISMADLTSALQSFNQMMVDYIIYGQGHPSWIPSIDFIKERERFKGEMLLLGGGRLEGAHSLEINRRQGIYDAVQHLADLGHRRISFAGYTQSDKFSGYMEGMAGLMLEYRSEYTINPYSPSFEQEVREILRRGDRPTAFIADSQMSLFKLIKILREYKIKIPDEISVVVYDDIPEMEIFEVPLTTVGPSIKELVDRSLDLLLTKTEETETGNNNIINPVLTIRHSTKAPI